MSTNEQGVSVIPQLIHMRCGLVFGGMITVNSSELVNLSSQNVFACTAPLFSSTPEADTCPAEVFAVCCLSKHSLALLFAFRKIETAGGMTGLLAEKMRLLSEKNASIHVLRHIY